MNPQDQSTDPDGQRQGASQGDQMAQHAVEPNLPVLTPSWRDQAGSDVQEGELQMQGNGKQIAWMANEFIAEDKSPGWFLAMVGVSLVIVLIVYFVTRDWFNALIVIIAAIIFGVAAGRPPRHLQYAVNDHGVQIGRSFTPYGTFRSFSVVMEGASRYIVLMPLKRFMPPLNLYYDPADEERIGDVLADHLPYAQHQPELTERLMRRIRF